MVMKPKLMCMLLMISAGSTNPHRQDVIEHLKEENNILQEKLGTEALRIRVSLVHYTSLLPVEHCDLHRYTAHQSFCYRMTSSLNMP
jgi:hypothetical protein